MDAAEAMLRERPFSAMTVDDLMACTGLARPSFYEYFRNRSQLVIKLLERIRALLTPMHELWLSGTGEPEADLRSAFEGLATVYRDHGHLIRALADASRHDKQVARAYGEFMEQVIGAVATRIRNEMRRGRTDSLDPADTARALVLMGERYMWDQLDRAELDLPLAVKTISTIWMRVLYANRR